MRPIPKSKLLAAVEFVLLAAILGTCGFLWRARILSRRVQPQEAPLPAQPPAAAPARVRPAPAQPSPDARVQRLALRQQRPVYAREFEQLYDNPQLNPLHLTEEQLDVLTECCSQLYSSRLALEASLAHVENVDGGGVLIEIPAYPDQGKALEQAFLASLSEKLGEPLAGAIEAQYLQWLEAQNKGLGQMQQEILASVDPDNPGHVKMVHDVAADDGSNRGTFTSELGESDFREYGPLAAFLPKP
jgi:hypothetical protein